MTKIHFRPYNPNQTVLFPQRIDEDIAENDPVRMVDALVEGLNLESFRKLYKECGRSPYHPKMMLKVILYAYMNNVYSCRKIEKLLLRDIHFIWLAGNEKPDFITINRFRNRVKDELDNVFTQLVLLLAERGFISLEVEYIDGTKIESKASKYTFVWRKSMETGHDKVMERVGVLLQQIDESIAQEKSLEGEQVEFVGEVAARFDLPTNVLRHWETVGLLRPPRDPAGRRRYGEDEVVRIAVIQRGLTTRARNTRVVSSDSVRVRTASGVVESPT